MNQKSLFRLTRPHFAKYVTTAVAAAVVAGCGGGGGGTATQIDADTGQAVSGTIIDGPVAGALLTVLDATGKVVGTTRAGQDARYQIQLDHGAELPLQFEAVGGTDLVTGTGPEMPLKAAWHGAGPVHITPFSTLITQIAAELGGLSRANLQTAAEILLEQLNFGIDPSLIPDMVSTDLDEAGTVNLAQASEGLAETLRRIRDALTANGTVVSTNEIIAALSGDLTDGALDGRGTGNADARVAATAHVAAAAVLVEMLENRLRVQGDEATSRMESAIRTMLPHGSLTPTDLAPSGPMLRQATTAVEAVRTFADDAALDDIAARLDRMTVRAESAAIPLGGVDIGLFDRLLARVAVANPDAIEAINAVVRSRATPNGGTTSPDNGGDAGESGPYVEVAGNPISIDVADFSGQTARGDHTWARVYPQGYTGTGAMQATPNVGTNVNTPSEASGLAYDVQFQQSGTYHVWVRGLGATDGDDSVSVGLNDNGIAGAIHGFGPDFGWGGVVEITVPAPGVHTVRLWMREDGFVADKLVLQRDGAAAPSGEGPAPSLHQSSGSTSPVDRLPVAHPDYAATEAGQTVDIDVLTNDSGLGDGPLTVAIADTPSHGHAQVTQANTIRYTPSADFSGTDGFSYLVTDHDGDSAMASVSVDVTGGSSTVDWRVALSWAPNSGSVDGYYVYFGTDRESVNQVASRLLAGSAGFNPQAPTIGYSARSDLDLIAGDSACFAVTAFNGSGESSRSETVCTEI